MKLTAQDIEGAKKTLVEMKKHLTEWGVALYVDHENTIETLLVLLELHGDEITESPPEPAKPSALAEQVFGIISDHTASHKKHMAQRRRD